MWAGEPLGAGGGKPACRSQTSITRPSALASGKAGRGRGPRLDLLTAEKKITVRDKRTRTKPFPSALGEGKALCPKTYSRNEALDLTVYCHAGLFVLRRFVAPAIYRDLGKLAEALRQGRAPEMLATRVRRVRTQNLL
jgi:phage terminase large subunit GpA-like protein